MYRRFFPSMILCAFFSLSVCCFWIQSAACADEGFQPSLASFVVSPTTVAPGDFVQCRFQFMNQGSQPSFSEERVFLHFTDIQNRNDIRWQADHQPPISTQFWTPNQEIVDGPLPIAVPETIADGDVRRPSRIVETRRRRSQSGRHSSRDSNDRPKR